MSNVISIKDFKRSGLAVKQNSDGSPLKKKGSKPDSDKPMFVEVSRCPRVIRPQAEMVFAPQVLVVSPARKVIADAFAREETRVGKKSTVILVRLHEDHTATLQEGRDFLDSTGCRLASVEEFQSFIITSLVRGEIPANKPFLALETNATDEYGFHQGMVYVRNPLKQEETVFLTFAERIRHDWLILAAHGRAKGLKKSTP